MRKILFLLPWVALFGCNDSFRDTDDDLTVARSFVISEQYAYDPFIWVHKLFSDKATLGDSIPSLDKAEGCVVGIEVSDLNSYPITFTIDFADDSITTCSDGRVRVGKLNGKIWRPYKSIGATIRIDAEVYLINGTRVFLTDSIRNVGRNESGNLEFLSRIREARIQGDTLNMLWSANQIWEWTSGEATGGYADDVLQASGNVVDALSYRGNNYETQIIEPIVWPLNCKWPTAGVIEQQPNNLLPRRLDYGEKTSCDNEVNVKILETGYTIRID